MLLGPSRWNETARDYRLRRTSEILRGPLEWSFDLTSRCVGRCLHCFNRSGRLPREEMDDETVLDLARQIAGMKPLGMCLCGGEPMLRADLACRVISILKDAGVLVNMVTSGALTDAENARALKSSGIAVVQVSLDGASPGTHERLRQFPGSFERAVRALEYLKEAGISTSVAFSPSSFNVGEFSDVVDLCGRLSVEEVRVQPLMPMGEALLNWQEIAPTERQYREIVSVIRDRACKEGEGPRITWGDPVDHLIRFGQYYAMVAYTLHITADGFLTPSVYLPFFFGNVRRHALDAYWRGGLAKVWDLRLVREYAFGIRSIEDMAAIRPLPFIDAPVELDLVEDGPKKIEEMTAVTLRLAESVKRLCAKNNSSLCME